jgi:beta-ureidopropionase / N-carbamoyl-L-amino-acid hydrolase
MPITLDQLNAAAGRRAQMLDGLYEHSPWIAEQALRSGPLPRWPRSNTPWCACSTMPAREPHLALIRAHPELAGKAMVSNTLTAESTNEQTKAGLTHCTPEEFAHIQQLNADYNARFGGPSSWRCAGRAARA